MGNKNFLQMFLDYVIEIKFEQMSHFVICIKLYKGQYFQHLALAGLKLYPCIELQELSGTTTNASQDCLFPRKNISEEPLEYKLIFLPCS